MWQCMESSPPTRPPLPPFQRKYRGEWVRCKTLKYLAWLANPGTISCLPMFSAIAPTPLHSACPLLACTRRAATDTTNNFFLYNSLQFRFTTQPCFILSIIRNEHGFVCYVVCCVYKQIYIICCLPFELYCHCRFRGRGRERSLSLTR